MLSLVPNAEFDKLKEVFRKTRMDMIRTEQKLRKQSKNKFSKNKISLDGELQRNTELNFKKASYDIALYVNVPEIYSTNVAVETTRRGGGLNVYFNKKGKHPLDSGHGHIVIDRFGEITYRRGVNEKHGPHNHINNSQPRLILVQSQLAN